MAIDFPTSPTVGQQYSYGGITYSFTAQGTWTVVAVAGGAVSLIGGTPQGRLTLQTNTPVMTTNQLGKTTLFYSPYTGNRIPLYDGTNFVMTAFNELSALTTDTTKSPAAVVASSVYDWFVWLDTGGVLRLSHGPPWTDIYTRSAGTALIRINGIWVNSASITNACAAQRGTYVGTTYVWSDLTLGWQFGAVNADAAATFGWFMVWNCYNRVRVSSFTGPQTGGGTYSGGFRNQCGDGNVRHYFVSGLAEDAFEAIAIGAASLGDQGYVSTGIGYDAISSMPVARCLTWSNTNTYVVTPMTCSFGTTALGMHWFAATDYTQGTASYIYSYQANIHQSGLKFAGMM